MNPLPRILHRALLSALVAGGLALPLALRAQAPDQADAEVRKVDRDAGRVTLKHGEIKSLDMPPMTMVFAVRDKALLDKLQPGDKVRVRVVSEGGRYVVTDIQPLR